jgi:hypothetical protein
MYSTVLVYFFCSYFIQIWHEGRRLPGADLDDGKHAWEQIHADAFDSYFPRKEDI